MLLLRLFIIAVLQNSLILFILLSKLFNNHDKLCDKMLSLHKRRPCENNCFGDEYLNITNFKSYCNCILSDNLKNKFYAFIKAMIET